MELHGYGSRTTLDGDALHIEPKGPLSKGAMGTSGRDILMADVIAISYKKPTPLVNGSITIQTAAGITQIHFLKKSDAAAQELFEAVQERSQVDPTLVPTGELANEPVAEWKARSDARIAASIERLAEAKSKAGAEAAENRASFAESAANRKADRAASKAKLQADLAKVEAKRRGPVESPRTSLDPFWADTLFVVAAPSKAALKQVRLHTNEEDPPWLFLTSPMAGALVAFEDRCMIVKTGLTPAFMSGALGGGRATMFPYRQITGIEYNSGMASGVLEILTPSYQGSSNQDFWKGAGRSPNDNTGNPFALSNTLPLPKSDFTAAAEYIDELRRRVLASHSPQPAVAAPVAAPAPVAAAAQASLSAELTRLAALRDSGVLDEDEFRQAKQAAITKHA